MLTELEGLSWFASTTAFQLNAPVDPESFIRQIRKDWPNLEIQIMDANKVAGHDHLVFASRNAVRALKKSSMISRSLSVEMLLYSSAHRQISKAIESIGLKRHSKTLALMAASSSKEELQRFEEDVSNNVPGLRDDALLEAISDERIREITSLFGITAKEIRAVRRRGETKWDAVKKLVVERVALLAIQT